jgi:putrescine transport system substrate-binding protein
MFARLALSLLLLIVTVLPTHAQDRSVNFYNWTDYIDPAVLQRFERETGIEVRYDVYDSLETLEAKLLAGHSGFDVVVPTSEPTFSRLVRAGALEPLDKAKIPNLANLDPVQMKQVASSDPGNRFGAIYLWGTTGLGYNTARVQALAPDAPADSWDLLLKPENAKRLAPCGITVLDSAIDVVPEVLHWLGRDANSTDPKDLAAVENALHAIRPYIRGFVGGGAVEQLASGETCLALDYSGDVIQAATRAVGAGKGVTVRYVAPREGAPLAFDMLAVPADAPHKQEAMALINFLLQPDVMAAITNKVRYPNAVPASKEKIDPAILNDPSIYPPPEAQAHFFTVGPVPPEVARARSRMWLRLKAGG